MDSEQKRQLCRVSASDSSFGPNGDAPQLRAGNSEVHAVGGGGRAAVSPSGRNTNGSRISVVIADDHPITRAGLDALLAREVDFRVLARCANAHEAVRAVSAYQPDILVLDQDLPVMDGVPIVKHLRQERPATRNVLIATTGTPNTHGG